MLINKGTEHPEERIGQGEVDILIDAPEKSRKAWEEAGEESTARGQCKGCGTELDEYCQECQEQGLSRAIHEMNQERERIARKRGDQARQAHRDEVVQAERERVLAAVIVLVKNTETPYKLSEGDYFQYKGWKVCHKAILEKLEGMKP